MLRSKNFLKKNNWFNVLLCCILWVIKKAINKKINISDKSIDKYIKIIIILIYIGIK